MANVLLKSVKFPDLEDTYIIGDESLSVSGAGADAKVTGDALATKADADGSYDNLTAGNAKQLISNVKVNDKTPYIFRTSGGSVDIGDREYVNGIVGGTVAWNQLVRNGNFADNSGWQNLNAGVTFSDNVMTVEKKVAGITSIYQVVEVAQNHKFFWTSEVKGDGAYESWVMSFGSAELYALPITTSWVKHEKILAKASTSVNFNVIRNNSEVTNETVYVKNAMVIDLTQMFGSTIADYIYSLEQSNAGAGVAWFRKLFNKPYYAYNAGELKSVEGLVSHDMTGFNQFDKSTATGGILQANGSVVQSLVCKISDYIEVVPNTTYYLLNVENLANGYSYGLYDADKNFIKVDGIYQGGGAMSASGTITTTTDTHYMRVVMRNAYLDSCCVNLSWDGSRNGEYEPYEKHSYALDSDLELRGIPKLDANNNLYYDGDVYESDGTVTRRYGVKVFDGTTGSWSEYQGAFYQAFTGYVRRAYATDVAISDKLRFVGENAGISMLLDAGRGTFGLRQDQDAIQIYPTDSSIDTATKLNAYLANNPLTVVYELATSTTETADPYQTPQIVSDFGTEEFVIDTDIAVPVPVGHDTDYPINVLSKVEMAPNSPDGDGDYIVRQTNGMNEYVPLVIEDALPTIPSTEGSYKLIVTVAEGSDPVLSWVSNA